ncbi:hypothetical protein [Haliscomenobacter sp.]|uniref:hypothetical protein n=1 Tax=Haliscomenobacter sp. TaxID=2717303 RepID=UPI003BA8E9D0
MEAIIISLLLFFSNADFALGYDNLDQSNQNTQTTTLEEGQGTYVDDQVVECSSGGKISSADLDGF